MVREAQVAHAPRTATQARRFRNRAAIPKRRSSGILNLRTLNQSKRERNCISDIALRVTGPNGKGDGGLALSGGEPSDLTDDAWDYGSTDGEIFVVIRDGVSADMLAYKERLSEKQIWQVVNYIRSIGPKQSKESGAK